jgi:hypothetical protein
MDTPSEKYKSHSGDRSEPFLAVLQTIQGFFTKLTGIFTVTKKELSDAGVYLGGEGRDE